jgi:hypothetical protein
MKNTIFLLILLVAMFLDAAAQELETTNLDSLMNAGAFTAESELQKSLKILRYRR